MFFCLFCQCETVVDNAVVESPIGGKVEDNDGVVESPNVRG